jgi:hypothetical protein
MLRAERDARSARGNHLLRDQVVLRCSGWRMSRSSQPCAPIRHFCSSYGYSLYPVPRRPERFVCKLVCNPDASGLLGRRSNRACIH